MHLLKIKGLHILGYHRLSAEQEQLSSGGQPDGEVRVSTVGSGEDPPQRRVTLLHGSKVLQPGWRRR